jgi:arsenate reductase (glutaredoxin)
MGVKIYHNPHCSKSRQTLQLLKEHGEDPEVVEYLKQPPTTEELDILLQQLNIADPRQLMRKNNDAYRTHQLDNLNLTRAELLAYMVKYPALIERPIVTTGSKAAIGRPPAAVLAILD